METLHSGFLLRLTSRCKTPSSYKYWQYDSTYSKWYLNEGQELAYLDSYYDINGYLEDCFQRFQALHKEVNTPAKKSSLFCSKEKCERERKERIDLQANNLYVSINNLIDMTKRIETQIMNLTDEEFEELL